MKLKKKKQKCENFDDVSWKQSLKKSSPKLLIQYIRRRTKVYGHMSQNAKMPPSEL